MRRFCDVLILTIALASWLAVAACHKARTPLPVVPEAPEVAPAPPGPPDCKLTAEPASIEQGKSVTLSWTSTNATNTDIEPDVGKQLSEGSATASPATSTTYVLTASGPGGTATCTARVTVSAAAAAPAGPSVAEENINGSQGAGALAGELKDVFFDYDSADLSTEAEQTLNEDSSALQAHPGANLVIEGNCDQRGSEEYNLALGQRRAAAARDFLVSLGVPAANISIISYGRDRLTCADNSEECWKQNRRDHLKLK